MEPRSSGDKPTVRTKVSVAVMAHPKREQWVSGLVDKLDAVVQVVWDQRNDRWDTGRRSLLAYDPQASHHLVIQDDAIICRDLVRGLTNAVEHSGGHPICCYMGRVRPNQQIVNDAARQARRAGSPWVKMPGPWWGVGVLLPVVDIPDIVKFGDGNPQIENYDLKISKHYMLRGVECLYAYPSLVDHRNGVDEAGKPNNESLVAGRTGVNRKAHRFIGENSSALRVDWSTRPVPIDVEPRKRM